MYQFPLLLKFYHNKKSLLKLKPYMRCPSIIKKKKEVGIRLSFLLEEVCTHMSSLVSLKFNIKMIPLYLLPKDLDIR